MRMKGLIGLVAVTVVAVALAVFLDRGGAPPVDPLVGKPVLPQIGNRLDAVARVTLVHGEGKTTLLRAGGHWGVEEKGGFPADAAKVRQMLLGLAELRYVEPKTRKPELYPRLEVEDAGKKDSKSTLVTLADDKGSLLGEVIAGKRRIDQLGGGNDRVYVRKPGDAQSWLASGSLEVSDDTPQWLDRALIDLPAAQVKELLLTGADGAKLTIARAKAADKFSLAELPKDKKLKNDADLGESAGALAGLELNDVRPAKDFEFPKNGNAEARFTTFDGLVVDVTITHQGEVDWARFSASGTGAAEKRAAEFNAKLQPWVFAISSYKAGLLQKKLADLVEAPKAS